LKGRKFEKKSLFSASVEDKIHENWNISEGKGLGSWSSKGELLNTEGVYLPAD
jgi:hypothetical protein